MDKRQTEISKEALKIFEQVLPLLESGKEFCRSFEVSDPNKIQNRLRGLAYEKGYTGIMYVSISGESIYVSRRRGEDKLRKLIRKMMASIDDEKLYEEAMEVLYGV